MVKGIDGNPHLAEIDAACKKRLDIIEAEMMCREGVTEALKAADQMGLL